MATAARALKPGIEIVGVQTERFPAVWNARARRRTATAARRRSPTASPSSRPGALTLPLIRERVDDVLLVGEDDIEQAILMLLEIEKTVVEGAGARRPGRADEAPRSASPAARSGWSCAAATSSRWCWPRSSSAAWCSSGRLARLRLDVRDVPGALADVATLLGRLGANIDEVQHQRAFTSLSVERAQIEVVVHTRGVAHIEEILAAMREQGYRAERVG